MLYHKMKKVLLLLLCGFVTNVLGLGSCNDQTKSTIAECTGTFDHDDNGECSNTALTDKASCLAPGTCSYDGLTTESTCVAVLSVCRWNDDDSNTALSNWDNTEAGCTGADGFCFVPYNCMSAFTSYTTQSTCEARGICDTNEVDPWQCAPTTSCTTTSFTYQGETYPRRIQAVWKQYAVYGLTSTSRNTWTQSNTWSDPNPIDRVWTCATGYHGANCELELCTPGQYNDGSGCTNCPLTQFSSTTTATECTDTSTCAAGQYIAAGPSGTVVKSIGSAGSTDGASASFAAVKADGSVDIWGDVWGDAPDNVPADLSGIAAIFGSVDAFAALKTDGTVEVWGDDQRGGCNSGAGGSGNLGDYSCKPDDLTGVVAIYSTKYAFAAVKSDNKVVVWGNKLRGGDQAQVGDISVGTISSTEYAFAAVKTDKSVHVWGLSDYGGNSNYLRDGPHGQFRVSELTNIQSIVGTVGAFAALGTNGAVYVWGHSSYGRDYAKLNTLYGNGDISSNVVTISSTSSAFAASKTDGSVVVWGNSDYGGTDPGITSGVTDIFSTRYAFAALDLNGGVQVWGRATWNTPMTDPGITSGVVTIVSAGATFTALDSNGGVKVWGDMQYGMTDPGITSGVETIFSTDGAFAALKTDGSVQVWGKLSHGGCNSGSGGTSYSCKPDALSNPGVYTSDRSCTSCPADTFSSTTNVNECSGYSTCAAADNKFVSQAGSATSDRQCADCAANKEVTTDNADACVCVDGYYSSGDSCVANQCTCEHGSGASGADCPNGGDAKCSVCDNGYHLDENTHTCVINQCQCTNGVAVADGAACPSPDDQECTSCNSGFFLYSGNECIEKRCELSDSTNGYAYTGIVGEYEDGGYGGYSGRRRLNMIPIPFEAQSYTLSELSYLSTSGNLQCANGYHGTPSLTICTEDSRDYSITPTDTQYTLTGCEPNVCVCEDDHGAVMGLGYSGEDCYKNGGNSCSDCMKGYHYEEFQTVDGDVYYKCLPNQCYCNGGDGRLTNGDDICYDHFVEGGGMRRLSTKSSRAKSSRAKSSRAKSSRLKSRRLDGEYVWFEEDYEWDDYGPHNLDEIYVIANGGNRQCTACTASGSVMINGTGTNGGEPGEQFCVCDAAAGFTTDCTEPSDRRRRLLQGGPDEIFYYPNTCIVDAGSNEYQVNAQSALKCVCDPAAHLVSDHLGGCECNEHDGYVSDGNGGCKLKQCTCEHGSGATGADCPNDGDAKCKPDGCNTGYHFDGCELCGDACVITPVCSDALASNYNEFSLSEAVFATAPVDNSLCEYDLSGDVTIEADIDLTNPAKKPSIKAYAGGTPKVFRKQYVRELFRRKASNGPTKFTMNVDDMLMDGFKRTYAAGKKVKMIEPRRIVTTIDDIAEETISTELKDEPIYAPLLEGEAVKLNLATKGGLVVKLHQTDASTLQVTVGGGSAVDIAEGESHVEQGISVSYGSGIVEDDVLCSAPASTTGYSNLPVGDIYNSAIAEYTAETCADGYSGTAVLGDCTEAAPTYVLSGCSINVCTCAGGTAVADGVDCNVHAQTQCQDCDTASQHIDGSNACVNDAQTSCSAGEGFSDGGSTGDSSCTACGGIQWSDGTTACQDYTAGVAASCVTERKTFIDGQHQADHSCSVQTCEEQGFGEGSSATSGSDVCNVCIEGYGGTPAEDGCIICPITQWNNAVSYFEQPCAPKACGLGYGVIGTGSTAESGAGSCEECPIGTYSNSPDIGECAAPLAANGYGCVDAGYSGTGCTEVEECNDNQHVVGFVCVNDAIYETDSCEVGQQFVEGESNTEDDSSCRVCGGNEQSSVKGICTFDAIYETDSCEVGQQFVEGESNTEDDSSCRVCVGNEQSSVKGVCTFDTIHVATNCANGTQFNIGESNILNDGTCSSCDDNQHSENGEECAQDTFDEATKCADDTYFTIGTSGILNDGTCTACDAHEHSTGGAACSQDSCVAPADTTGYANIQAGQWDLITAVCADSHYGTATVTPCNSDGGEFQLSGCALKVCTCALGTASEGIECGTHNTESCEDCSDTSTYHLEGSGCHHHECVKPSIEGYDTLPDTLYTNNVVSEIANNVGCAAGYSGTPVGTRCTSDGAEYTVTGCSRVSCDASTSRSPVATGVGCWCGDESVATVDGEYCIHGNTQTKPLCPLSSSAASADCRCYTPDTSLASECSSGQFCDSGGCLAEMDVDTMRSVDPSSGIVQSEWDSKAAECSAGQFVHLQQDNTLACAACSRATFRSTYAYNNILDAQGADNVPDKYKHYKCCINPDQAVCQAMKDAYISNCKQDGVCAADNAGGDGGAGGGDGGDLPENTAYTLDGTAMRNGNSVFLQTSLTWLSNSPITISARDGAPCALALGGPRSNGTYDYPYNAGSGTELAMPGLGDATPSADDKCQVVIG